MKFKLLAMLFVALSLVFSSIQANSITDIQDRGVLTVGVKSDFEPYGFRDPSGALIGIEVDLAQEIADRLNVELALVPVVASNRVQFLKNGKIDIIIATMADTKKRRLIMDFPHPNYYSSGPTVLGKISSGITKWTDLDGMKLCGILGGWVNEPISTQFNFTLINFKTTGEAYKALRDNRCVAFLYEDVAMLRTIEDAEWAGYGLLVPNLKSETYNWGMGVRKGEHELVQLLGEITAEWHSNGTILFLERKYGLTNSSFALEMHSISK